MQTHYHKKSAGFTLVEIMIVVAIIALLAAIALPNFLRARKRSQASTVINDLRIIDAAMDQYAIDTGKQAGFNPTFADVQNYLKTDTLLYSSGSDILGDSYGPYTVDSITQVPTSAFNAYSDVADASFWGQFYNNSGLSSEQTEFNSDFAVLDWFGSGGGSGTPPTPQQWDQAYADVAGLSQQGALTSAQTQQLINNTGIWFPPPLLQ